nr:MAG TPA: hypothetical protein [Caudoviricetes sp.]
MKLHIDAQIDEAIIVKVIELIIALIQFYISCNS